MLGAEPRVLIVRRQMLRQSCVVRETCTFKFHPWATDTSYSVHPTGRQQWPEFSVFFMPHSLHKLPWNHHRHSRNHCCYHLHFSDETINYIVANWPAQGHILSSRSWLWTQAVWLQNVFFFLNCATHFSASSLQTEGRQWFRATVCSSSGHCVQNVS